MRVVFAKPFAAAFALCVCAACSKDPNAPDATTPVTGTWVSTDTVAVFTGFHLNIVQSDNGLLSGTWNGTTKVVNGSCSADLTCTPSNILFGSNLSLSVELQVLGAGTFVGQLKTKNELVGHFLSYGETNPAYHFRRQ